MRNEVRNSIILASLLIIIFIMRIVLSAGTAKQIKAENDLLAKNKAELASLQYIIIDTMQIYHIKQKISKLDSWQEQNGKSFVARDNSRKTWSYLNTIIQNYAPILDINFTNNGDDSDENSNHDYHITGTTDMQSLYSFINHIENQKPFYIINEPRINRSIQFEEDGTRVSKVSFDIRLQSIVSSAGLDINNNKFKKIASHKISNFFNPKIYSPYDDPKEINRLDSEKLVLLSLTPQKAFVKTDDGQIIEMKEGHRVAFGYLKSINWNNQTITFSLNKIGIYKDFILELNKE